MANPQFKKDVDGLVEQTERSKVSPATIERVKKFDHKLGDLAEKFNDAGNQIKKYVQERKQ